MEHQVKAVVNKFELRKGEAMKLIVKAHDKVLGTITIGQGTFRWTSKHGKKYNKVFSWSKFAELMDRQD
ncbi:MAG: hypothetical protein Q8J64_04115 [Thermodesulfovibrionales bacterium]|nr:hypothetical protein [Thermodesulfovibrionales bacterium]